MFSPSEIASLFNAPQPDPAAIEAALERYALTVELQALEIIQGFSGFLARLPIPDMLRKSSSWRAITDDPVLAGNAARIGEVRARLAELSKPAA